MSPGPIFDRVYLALKDRLMSAGFAPGQHLEPALLGDELHASSTPVRDALHRLVGERMVEAPGHEGFRVPAPSEGEVRDLFGWSATLVDLALRRPQSAGLGRAGSSVASLATGPLNASGLFLLVAELAGNREQLAVFEGLSDRLAAIRSVEPAVFSDVDEEFAELHLIFASGDRPAFRRGAAAHHRRRQRAAPDLLAALRRRTDQARR